MDTPLRVNDVIDRLQELSGKDVVVQGLLHYRFEDVALYHVPLAEQRPDYGSSIWLTMGHGAPFDPKLCESLDGKLVTVTGRVFEPHSILGAGHTGLWPAQILPRTLEPA